MALKVEKMTREFVFNGMRLPDPNPALTAEEARGIFALTYPEITTAALEGPAAVNAIDRASGDHASASGG